MTKINISKGLKEDRKKLHQDNVSGKFYTEKANSKID